MGKIKESIFNLIEKIKSIKHIEIIITVIAIVIMFVIYFGTSCDNNKKVGIIDASSEYYYRASVVKELEDKLSVISGVGSVSVLINWTTDETGDTPSGVIIICDGGNDISVKMKLIASVASYFGISENQVNVLAKI